MGIGLGFGMFGVMFTLVFVLFIVMFAVVIGKSIRESSKNNHSPVLTVSATVVSKRTHVRGDHAHTYYFATFQVDSGDRMELKVPDYQFGYLVEGDRGSLTFQGTRFHSFVCT